MGDNEFSDNSGPEIFDMEDSDDCSEDNNTDDDFTGGLQEMEIS